MSFDLTDNLIDRLAYTTVRIELVKEDIIIGYGTGFVYDAHINTETKTCTPVVITNKHVLKGGDSVHIKFCKVGNDNKPIDQEHVICKLDNLTEQVVMHPDTDVDLCAFYLYKFLIETHETATLPFYRPSLNRSHLITKEELNKLSVFEDIMMVGYPSAIWDEINNKPIFRHGMTATHINKDYCGKKEFLIDAAVYPGSSGSPVFLYQKVSLVLPSTNKLETITNARLIGIAFRVYQHAVQGGIKMVDIPTVETPIATSNIPNHLGIVIKAERIKELEAIIPT